MQTQNFQLGTGAWQSPEDLRDWTPASVGAPTVYADSCFIEEVKRMRVSMQGGIGCCVGCTYEEIVRLIIFLLTGTEPTELSWRWVYAICKGLDRAPGEGTFPSIAAKVIRTYGVPLAKYCPNNIAQDHESFVYNRTLKDEASIIATLGQEAYDDAQTRKAGADVTFPATEDGIQQAVTYAKLNKGGVAICRQIGNTYWTREDGVSSWKRADLCDGTGIRVQSVTVSGHEELIYGYDREPVTNRLRIYWLNHWSDAWCSTSGIYGNSTNPQDHDGGRSWEYADIWLKNIGEIRVSVPATPPAPETFKYAFNSNLMLNSEGPDVVALQHALTIDGEFTYGKFTGHFGPVTKQAVLDFQKKYGIDQVGQVGPVTRAKLNSLFNK